MPDLKHERRIRAHLGAAGARVAGIDEAGRGPLAGPVVAAAVVLPERRLRCAGRIDDSKKLMPKVREELFEEITGACAVGVGRAEVEEIDALNILHATMLAMDRALAALPETPSFALVDGNRLPALPCEAEAIVGGDALCLSIAAASIIAKVTRDREMRRLAESFPGYGWETNVGYRSKVHLDAIVRLGPTPHHRRSFPSVARILNESI